MRTFWPRLVVEEAPQHDYMTSPFGDAIVGDAYGFGRQTPPIASRWGTVGAPVGLPPNFGDGYVSPIVGSVGPLFYAEHLGTVGAPATGPWAFREPFLPGTHLRTPRGFYSHHGIYVGNGYVVEFSGDRRKDIATASVRLSTLDYFRDGQRIFVVPHVGEATYSPDVIVQRAYAMLGWGGYNLLFRNCEHVATSCVNGRFDSQQVRVGVAGTIVGYVLLALLFL